LRVDSDDDGTFETQKHFYRLLGDTNGDRRVTSLDQQAVSAVFGQTGTRNADVNGDWIVNSKDRELVNKRMGKLIAAHLPLDD
jgi:hypothetical protein